MLSYSKTTTTNNSFSFTRSSFDPMTCSLTQDYSYALNKTGRIVKISDASRGDSYRCPCCGADMVPHMGAVRRWHFTHKAGTNCSYETYLHKVAKVRIREAFLSSDTFAISYNPLHICAADCPFNYAQKCSSLLSKSFDIRKYYDVCEEETSYGGFRPDLHLRSSQFPDREPIFIEIHVSHKSSESKISAGHRLIELTIESETDINNIVERKIFEGVTNQSNSFYFRDAKCVFFNFNRTYPASPKDFISDTKYVLGIKDDGYYDMRSLHCYEPVSKYFPSNEYNILISNARINLLWAYAELEKRGLKIINCSRCKYNLYAIASNCVCTHYTTYGSHKSSFTKSRGTCPYYETSDINEFRTPICHLRPNTYNPEKEAFYQIIMRSKD